MVLLQEENLIFLVTVWQCHTFFLISLELSSCIEPNSWFAIMSGETPSELTFRDRDVFQDKASRIFMTIGHIQPPNRVICFLKYVPDPFGLWYSDGVRFRRVFNGGVSSVVAGMADLPRSYLLMDEHFGTVLPEVPHSNVMRQFSPEERLNEILQEGPKDTLEEVVVLVAEAVHDYLRIDPKHLGVTGSIVWRGHNPSFSDVNINVYGFNNGWCVHDMFESLTNHPEFSLCRMSDWSQSINRLKNRISALGDSAIIRLFERRLALCHKRLRIAITPVLFPQEAPIRYGSESYETVTHDVVSAKMTITDASYGIFIPSILTCEPTPVSTVSNIEITRVMIYDGAFRGLFRSGDKVEVVGTLQRVTFPEDENRHEYQLMLGTQAGAGREFIRLL